MFWIIGLALVAAVAIAVLTPIWRARGAGAAQPAAAYDLQVYRDQLREVERDLERGVINAEDAARLRTEIGRKVLDADRRMAETAGPARSGGTGIAAILVMAGLLAGAVALYWREGVPGAPDLPLARRIALAQEAYDNRPSQAEAESTAPAPTKPEVDPDYEKLVEQLREAVAGNPDDPQGLALLSNSEMRLGNIAAARDAQARLVEIRGDQASAEELMQLSALMMETAGGLITPEAEQVLATALKKDPRQPQARYLLGLLQLQNGRPDRAFPLWRDLLEEGPADAPWIAPIRASIGDLAWLAGHPDYVPPEAAMTPPGMPALPGPDADAMAAAQDMSPEDRQQMIGGMVARLEARLANQGGTPEEWARLISSLVVIGDTDHAREIWTEAQARFDQQPEALATILAAAQQAGLAE